MINEFRKMPLQKVKIQLFVNHFKESNITRKVIFLSELLVID